MFTRDLVLEFKIVLQVHTIVEVREENHSEVGAAILIMIPIVAVTEEIS